jgi:cytochrome c-type biogenesis protein CcsB
MNKHVMTKISLVTLLVLGFVSLMVVGSIGGAGGPATAQAPEKDRQVFFEQVNLEPLQLMSVQHNQTLKTFDTYARQVLTSITGKPTLDGRPAVYTLFDMSFRPEAYQDRNLIKIKNAPLRKDICEAPFISPKERERIKEEGTISLALFTDPQMQKFLAELANEAAFKNDAVGQLMSSATSLRNVAQSQPNFLTIHIVPPVVAGDQNWKLMEEVLGNMPPAKTDRMRAAGQSIPPPLPGYEGKEALFGTMFESVVELLHGWRGADAGAVNAAIGKLTAGTQTVNPAAYPMSIKRQAEVVYNRMFKLTIPAAMLYFTAFACFVVAAYSHTPGVRLWGLRFFILAFVVHTIGIAVRWWLISKSVGNWFESIPIKNQFESVLFSSWFGAMVGLIFELRRSRGVYGAAASFVGWLSLVAIFSAPYVAGRDIGGEIGQSAGVLMSYWLYIHVTMAVASYALIGMSFLLGVWWLVKYYSTYRTLSKVPARQLSADAASADYSAGGGGNLSFAQTIARLVWLPVPVGAGVGSVGGGSVAPANTARTAIGDDLARRQFLATLDQCNLVVMQLAFWVLGVAIILGAVWADQSWGRPWGWDPKETFALVTWIVYLAVVHIRLATSDKAWWTAVLSIVGFFVMLFNWIGVNYFLVGLHSYA